MHINKKIVVILLTGIIVLVIGYFSLKQQNIPEPSVTASVTTEQAQLIHLTEQIIAYGTVGFSPDQIKQISLQNETLITNVFVIPGQKITPKAPLIQLSPSNSSKLTTDNAQLNVDFAEKELTRLIGLRKQFLATNAEVQAATQTRDKAQIELLTLQKQQKGMILNSEFEGTVQSVNVFGIINSC
jgi:multidrug efflux pump subunit AcrA (membrane-fusion protein)